MDLSAVPSSNPQRLRQRFLEEAQLLAKLNLPGILRLRDAFEEGGTAYYVTDALTGARTLDRVLAQEGRMTSEGTQDILFQLLDILEALHEHRVLHRDIKPSNILISPRGEVYLIDFGAAREWHADSAVLHTVLFTPGYAPIEQLSERGKRGPASDIYSLCATAYHMLTGFPPRSAAERADGTEMVPLSQLRPDVDHPVLTAITAGLKLRFRDRPQSIQELRQLLMVPAGDDPARTAIETFDATAVRLERFSYTKRACPACDNLLEEPRPIKTGLCPVCHGGPLKTRELSERLCGHCHTGILQLVGDKLPILFCPTCKVSPLDIRKEGLIRRTLTAHCDNCQSTFKGNSESAILEHDPNHTERTWVEWRQISGRAREAWICDLCEAQFDVLPSGQWREYIKKGATGRQFFPQEWARIAVGLRTDAGNATCGQCGADYWLDENTLSLLEFQIDPFNFGAAYLGKAIPIDDVGWNAVGKSSGHNGLVCHGCSTEFDHDGKFLTLVHSPNIRLQRHAGRSLVIEDWHRIAQALPLVTDEEAFYDSFDQALVDSFNQGELAFDDRDPEVLWEGPAKEVRPEEGEIVELSDGNFSAKTEEIIYGRLFRKWRVPLSSVAEVEAEDDLLWLRVSGEDQARCYEILPSRLSLQLQSGERRITLRADSLAAVLALHMHKRAKPEPLRGA